MKVIFSLLLIGLAGLEKARGLPKNYITKIVGGEPATQGQIPYILSLQINGEHHCGASIIQVEGLMLAVSAAHCSLFDADKFNVTVVAGELKLSNKSGHEQTRRVTRIVNHDFSYLTMKNDISLLFIEEPFQLNENVKAISLPPSVGISNGSVRVSGWGLTEQNGLPSDDLRTVVIPVVDDKTCNQTYGNREIYEDFLCAGKLGEGGIDSCQQDSGGPAVQDNRLVGIVSFGTGCALPDFPGVYTEVSYFNNWIRQQVDLHLKNQ